jgi:hypothetical protein
MARVLVPACRTLSLSPEQLHTDLAMVGQWLGDMRDARITTIVGLVHVDMAALQRTALPAINAVHRCGPDNGPRVGVERAHRSCVLALPWPVSC